MELSGFVDKLSTSEGRVQSHTSAGSGEEAEHWRQRQLPINSSVVGSIVSSASVLSLGLDAKQLTLFEHYLPIAPEAEISDEHQILWVDGNPDDSAHQTYLKLFETKKFNVKACIDVASFTAVLEAKVNKTRTSKMT